MLFIAALFLAAPLFTTPHTTITMSNNEIAMSNEDIYGQRHPVENPDLIASKLQELNGELALLSSEQKLGWTQAQEKCDPSLVNDDFKLQFLRCEVFNADVRLLNIKCL